MNNDTVFYVCDRPSGGWVMYSSDTRVPAIIAQSENGSYAELLKNENAQLWIQSIVEDMSVIKNLPDEQLNFSRKEIVENKAFWESIASPNKYVEDKILSDTRVIDKIIVPTSGHYELRTSTSSLEVYDSISSMTSTSWSQNSPYNYYCPLTSNNLGHAPAGCVAIAGAQMLYFLHFTFGVPSTAPSKAYCEGNVNSYTWEQTDYSSTIWSDMATSGYSAAPLIADVGRRLNMQYGDNESGASTEDLVKKYLFLMVFLARMQAIMWNY